MSPVAHPVGVGVPDGPQRRTFEYRRTFVYPSVGAGVPDGPQRRTLEYRRTLVYPSVGAGVPDGPYRRTLEYRRTLVYPSVGAGASDGPFSVLRLRAAPASCMYASGGHISFNSERNMEKNAAKNRRFLDFPFVQL